MKKVTILFVISIFFCQNAFSQNLLIRGQIISEEDQKGLPGVNVTIKGSIQGTVTDTDGKYTIKVPSNSTVLKFSSIGFIPHEVSVGDRQVINLTLKPDVKAIDDVVVIGYGQQKKASIVGAISNIKNEDLKRAAPSNLTSAIGGRITGAVVRLGDGNVGGGDNGYTTASLDNAEIFIRGKATTNSAEPLILVDGVESSFSRINPEDVEQFSVLKDASATAVYGVRGANGVILVTTKSGSIGKPRVTINSQVRMHKELDFPKPLGAYDYAVLYNEALRNAGKSDLYTEEDLEHWRTGDDPYGHPDVNWYDEIVKDHFFEHQYNANVTGGTEFVKYYLSGEYNHAGGPFDAPERNENIYNRYNLRTNFDFQVTKSTEFDVKLNGRLEEKGDVNYGESSGDRYYGSFWYGILASLGNIAPVYNPDGTYAYGSSATWNLRATLDEGGYRRRLSNTMDANFNLKQKLDFLLEGLSARGMFGLVYSSGTRKKINPEKIPELWYYNPATGDYTLKQAKAVKSYAIDKLAYTRRTHWEFALNYEKMFAEKHRFSAMAIYIQSKDESNYDLPNAYRGVSGRITYDYKSKYLSEFNMGYNGSDQFSKGHRYALLPAGSLGWVMSEEQFMKDHVRFINFLKIRGSYGTAGNDQIGDYDYLYRYEFNATTSRYTDYANEIYNFGVTPVSQTGIREGTLGNERVSWEIAKKFNAGIDLRAFEDKISLTADIFHEKRDKILVIRNDIPTQTGLTTEKLPAENLGKVTNRGYEVELSYSDKIGDFGFTLGGNYTFARNRIDYIAEVQKKYDYQMQVNHPVGQPFGYMWTGKFYDYDDLENPEVPKPEGTVYAGDLMFRDLNDDGVINDYDVTAIGYSTIPEKIYGFNTGFTFKNFYLDTFWQGAANICSRYGSMLRYEFSPNVLPIHLGRRVYDPERGLDTSQTATYPSLIIGGSPQTTANSTFQLQNSSYLRLKSAEFGYDFPRHILERTGFSAMRVFISGSNLITFDHIKGIDPEYKSGTGGNYYPQTKFYAIGLNITL